MNHPSTSFQAPEPDRASAAGRWRRSAWRLVNVLTLVAIVVFAGTVLFPRLATAPRAAEGGMGAGEVRQSAPAIAPAAAAPSTR